MSGFELRIQGVGSDRSTNLASTTAHPSPPIGGRGIPRGRGPGCTIQFLSRELKSDKNCPEVFLFNLSEESLIEKFPQLSKPFQSQMKC